MTGKSIFLLSSHPLEGVFVLCLAADKEVFFSFYMMYEARKFFSGIGTQVILCISSLKSFPLIILLFTSCVEEYSELSNMGILIDTDYRHPQI